MTCACLGMLGAIGSVKSIPHLEKNLTSKKTSVKSTARAAIKAIDGLERSYLLLDFRSTFVPNSFPSISLHLNHLHVFTKKHPGYVLRARFLYAQRPRSNFS
jgi:hypothetical protein